MKELKIEQIELVKGGEMSNLSKAMCTASTIAWAAGALTSMSGFGLVLWGVGAAGVIYCNGQMAGVIPE